jgi:hypothetical protein
VNQQDFFEDTWNHFVVNKNPPGKDPHGSGCSYIGGCAIGRHMDKEWCKKAEGWGEVGEVVDNPELKEGLIEKFPDFPLAFLQDIQGWHDTVYNAYWEKRISHNDLLQDYVNIGKQYNLSTDFLEAVAD